MQHVCTLAFLSVILYAIALLAVKLMIGELLAGDSVRKGDVMASVSVRLNRITKRFGEKTVLDRFSFSAPEGQITTLLGPSRCGKSTAIRLIAGLDNPNEGEIWLGDEAVYLEDRGEIVQAERRDISMVFKHTALWPHKTVAENVAFPLRVRHMPKQEIRNRIREALALSEADGL